MLPHHSTRSHLIRAHRCPLKLEALEDRLPPGDLGLTGLLALPEFGLSFQAAELPAVARQVESGTRVAAPSLPVDTDVAPVSIRTSASPRAETPPLATAGTAEDRQLSDTVSAQPWGDGGSVMGPEDLFVGPNMLTHDRTPCPGGQRGRTQSETTIAVTGFHVVVGFNDFRGFGCPNEGSGYQVTGWAYSIDYGETFLEGGPLPGRTNLRGDPWLAVGPDGTFYFASLSSGPGGMAVLRGTGTETGVEWSNPTYISPGGSHDKEAMVVDQNTGAIYITYTRFGGPGGIALFKSEDGGLSFQGPVTVRAGEGQGSFPVVGPNSELYVAWNLGYPNNRAIGFAKSLDGGATFSAESQINTVCNFLIPGFDRGTHPLLPTMAVDLSGGPYHGSLYVVHATACDSNNGDVVLLRSSDGGETWSSPVLINDDGTTGIQWYPSVSVDALGNVNVFFYDRRENPGTITTNLYFAQSNDGGKSFGSNVKVTDVPSNWTSVGEGPNYGDYINSVSLGTDALVAYADGRDGDPDTYFTRVSLV